MTQTILQEMVEAIADSRDVDPVELELVLADHIDVDAVSQLAAQDTGTWTLSFELPDLDVTVGSDGTVLVDERPQKSRVVA